MSEPGVSLYDILVAQRQLSRGVAASSGVRETQIHAMLKFSNKTLFHSVKWYDAPVNGEDTSSGWDEEKAASARQQRSYLTILNMDRYAS